MKKITLIFIGFLLIANCSKAQITFEHEYPLNNQAQSLDLIQLDVDVYKYLYVDYLNNQFKLYNMDHSIYRTVVIPYTSYSYNILYVTRSLFDCDSNNVEYLLNHNANKFVKILRTDGTEIFFADSAQTWFWFGGSPKLISLPITKTSSGSKLLLRYDPTGSNSKMKIYALCGDLPAAFADPSPNSSSSKAYPNPTVNQITVEYKLPTGDNIGQLMLFDMTGKQVREYTVDNTFSNILITTSSLSPGTYYYTIKTKSSLIKGQKIIKIE